MAQIAQQDHLYVDIANPASLTTAEKKALWDKYVQGTLLDVVIYDVTNKTYTKVIAYTFGGSTPNQLTIVVYDMSTGETTELSFTNPYA